jgi:hypothetical protein
MTWAPPPETIPIIEKKLGRHYRGLAYDDPHRVEIDSRLRGEEQQEVLLHELLHLCCPELDEDAVTQRARWMARQTWAFGLRRIQV